MAIEWQFCWYNAITETLGSMLIDIETREAYVNNCAAGEA